MRRILLAFLAALVIFSGGLSGEASAQVPKILNYQAELKDDAGNPINSTIVVSFSLYTARSGGQLAWTETHELTAKDGFINVYLGTVEPIDITFDKEYFLEVKVGNSDPYPRTALTSTPYTLFAAESDNARKADIAELAKDVEDGAITQDKLAPDVKTNPIGAAGGDLSGEYPDPAIKNGAVTTQKIASKAVTSTKIDDEAVTSGKIGQGAVNIGHIRATGNFSSNHVLKVVNQATGEVGWGSIDFATSLGGDLRGKLPSPIVYGWRGRPLSTLTPQDNDVYNYDAGNNQWIPGKIGVDHLYATKAGGTRPNADGTNGNFIFYKHTGPGNNLMTWSTNPADNHFPVWDAGSGAYVWQDLAAISAVDLDKAYEGGPVINVDAGTPVTLNGTQGDATNDFVVTGESQFGGSVSVGDNSPTTYSLQLNGQDVLVANTTFGGDIASDVTGTYDNLQLKAGVVTLDGAYEGGAAINVDAGTPVTLTGTEGDGNDDLVVTGETQLNGSLAIGDNTPTTYSLQVNGQDVLVANTTFGGDIASDVTGTYDNLQLKAGVVTLDEAYEGGAVINVDVGTPVRFVGAGGDGSNDLEVVGETQLGGDVQIDGDLAIGDNSPTAFTFSVNGQAALFENAAFGGNALSDINGTYDNLQLKTASVGSDEIATGAVDSDEIATDAVGSDEIATGAVDSDEIATDAVTSSEVDLSDTYAWTGLHTFGNGSVTHMYKFHSNVAPAGNNAALIAENANAAGLALKVIGNANVSATLTANSLDLVNPLSGTDVSIDGTTIVDNSGTLEIGTIGSSDIDLDADYAWTGTHSFIDGDNAEMRIYSDVPFSGNNAALHVRNQAANGLALYAEGKIKFENNLSIGSGILNAQALTVSSGVSGAAAAITNSAGAGRALDLTSTGGEALSLNRVDGSVTNNAMKIDNGGIQVDNGNIVLLGGSVHNLSSVIDPVFAMLHFWNVGGDSKVAHFENTSGTHTSLYVKNGNTTSNSKAIVVDGGGVVLKYADAGASADLSSYGYASIISVNGGVTVTNLPSGTNGQILWIYANGGNVDLSTNVGLTDVSSGNFTQLVYIGGWKEM